MDIVFFLNEQSIAVFDQRAKTHQQGFEELFFEWNEEERLQEYLETVSSELTVAAVLDFVDEVIETDWFPKPFPWEKATIEKRMVQKASSTGAEFVNFSWQSETQKNEHGAVQQAYRVVSIAQNPDLRNFFDTLEANEINLLAIYSNTFLIDGLYSSLIRKQVKISAKEMKAPTMVVFRESPHIFRQVFLENGDIKLTRLVEIDDELEGFVAILHAVVDETNLAVKYIYNQKLLPYNTPISLVYVDDDQDSQDISQELYQDNVVQASWEEGEYVVKACDYEPLMSLHFAGLDSSFRNMVATYVLQKSPKPLYANDYSKTIYSFIQAKQAAFITAFVVLFVGLFLAGQVWVENQILASTKEALDQQTVTLDAERDRIQKRIKFDSDAEDIKEIVVFSEQVLKARTDYALGYDIVSLSEIIARHPNIQLVKMEWQNAGTFDELMFNIEIHGLVFPFEQAFDMPVQWVDAFVEDLKTLASVKDVTLQKEPLDRKLTQALTVPDSIEEVNALPFSLKVEMKPHVATQ